MRTWFLLLLLSCLTACGFHLRGPMPLAPPLQRLHLQSKDPYGQLSRNLLLFLKLSGVHVVANPAEASAILVILNEQTQDQLVGITGNQETRQYNLILSVTFQVTDPQGKVLLSPQIVSETSTLAITAGQILAGSNEASNLYQQMRQAIVYDILSRLSSHQVSRILLNTYSR